MPVVNIQKNIFDVAEYLNKEWMDLCDLNKQPEVKECTIGDTSYEAALLYFMEHPSIRRADQINQHKASELHFALRWRSFGYPTFDLTQSLAASFLLTDCSSIKGCDFKFPFPSFLITLPYPNSPIPIHGTDRELRAIAVHNIRIPSSDEDREKWGAHLRTGRLTTPPNVEWETLTDKRIFNQYGLCGGADYSWPRDERTIEEWLGIGDIRDGLDEAKVSAIEASSRLVANLCLYLDAMQQDGKDPLKPIMRKKSLGNKRKPGAALPPAWILGRDIKLNPELRAAARQVSTPKTQHSSAWTLQSQHVVRGHWKMQAHGSGRSLRKKIRVEPYWRGPRLSEAVLRSFTEKT